MKMKMKTTKTRTRRKTMMSRFPPGRETAYLVSLCAHFVKTGLIDAPSISSIGALLSQPRPFLPRHVFYATYVLLYAFPPKASSVLDRGWIYICEVALIVIHHLDSPPTAFILIFILFLILIYRSAAIMRGGEDWRRWSVGAW